MAVLRSVGWASAHADDPRELRKEQHGLKPILQTANRQLPTVSWVPWFPVIDYDRCRNCKQCLNFCLFGVYQLSPEGKVEVQNPSGCKTNCPACARMCPQKAIIFPKYADAPINGDETPAAIADCGLPSADSSRVVISNPRSAIRNRTTSTTGFASVAPARKRFSTEPKEGTPGPSCPTLDRLRRELDIPDEVLAALSPAELQRTMARKNPGQPQSDSTSK